MKSLKTIILPKKKTAVEQFSKSLCREIRLLERPFSELVCVCIGTELVTGDSLGPLVGHRLSRLNPRQVFVYGTLQEPIHALNLNQRLGEIAKRHPAACTLAIDASFGLRRHLGTVAIQPGPLYPGLGVEKELPPVGNISITGIVCTTGPHANTRLKDTPLSLIVPQVDIISDGILAASRAW